MKNVFFNIIVLFTLFIFNSCLGTHYTIRITNNTGKDASITKTAVRDITVRGTSSVYTFPPELKLQPQEVVILSVDARPYYGTEQRKCDTLKIRCFSEEYSCTFQPIEGNIYVYPSFSEITGKPIRFDVDPFGSYSITIGDLKSKSSSMSEKELIGQGATKIPTPKPLVKSSLEGIF